MGIHDHRFRLGRVARQAYDRAAEATDEIKTDFQRPSQISRWPKLVIGLGAAATIFWLLILGWLVLGLLWRLTDWIGA